MPGMTLAVADRAAAVVGVALGKAAAVVTVTWDWSGDGQQTRASDTVVAVRTVEAASVAWAVGLRRQPRTKTLRKGLWWWWWWWRR
jgi:hypothetical protein